VDPGSQRKHHAALVIIVALVYGFGLTRDFTEPWIGLHDWNGAFYSQLARNLNRYPFSMHHGMPVVAMGEKTPSPTEKSSYARHPPGLAWVLAGAFKICGESEAVARSVSIVASLGSVILLIHLVSLAHGRVTGLVAGAIYALMPMSIYFGRMVNHEPVCLFFMLLTATGWRSVGNLPHSRNARSWAMVVCCLSLWVMAWMDWPGILFAGVFCIAVLWQWRQNAATGVATMACLATTLVASASVLIFLVYVGLNGRWEDLAAIVQARRETVADISILQPLQHVVSNLTWPIAGLWGLGVAMPRLVRNSSFSADPAGAGAMNALSITGWVWALAFWRQFQIHEYWMFYLGPCVAAGAAVTFVKSIDVIRTRQRSWALFVALVLALVIGAFCIRGTMDYYQRVKWPAEEWAAWREIHDATSANERVALAWSPIAVERQGHYEFRNIVPAQMAYYLDRAFDVIADSADAERFADDHRMLVFRARTASLCNPLLAGVAGQCPAKAIGPLVVVGWHGPVAQEGR